MSKIQNYEIVFNEPQDGIAEARAAAAQTLPTAIVNLITNGLADGSIIRDTHNLDSDGTTLTVSRTWTDTAYSSLLAETSIEDMITAVENSPNITSVTCTFVDP
jgi:hypothetical protein